MNDHIKRLNICMGPFGFTFDSVRIPDEYVKKFRPFLSRKKGGCIVKLKTGGWKVKTKGIVKLSKQDNSIKVKREDFYSTINTCSFACDADIKGGYLSFNSYFRVLSSIFFAHKSAAMFHASGVVMGGGAHLFVGKSGSGKTTIIRNTHSLKDMGDEMIGIVKKDGGYFAFSTPFGGELGVPKARVTRPLKAIYFIKKSRNIRITKLGKDTAFRSLMRCAVNFSKYETEVIKITDLAGDIVRDVPVFLLHTTIDSSFLNVYNSCMPTGARRG